MEGSVRQMDMQNDPNVLLANLAVENRILTDLVSREALSKWEHGSASKDFGMFLVSENLISPNDLWELMQERDKKQGQNGKLNGASAHRPVTAEPTNRKSSVAAPVNGSNGFTSPPVRARTRAPAASTSNPTRQSPGIANRASERPDIGYREGASLSSLLSRAIELKSSDLHLHCGAPISIRVGGEIKSASEQALSLEESERLVNEVLSEQQRERLGTDLQLDFAFELNGIGRFRANAYRQQRGLDAVFRIIPPSPPSLEELGMPAELGRLGEFHQGLVLFTGPSGCGKSSTMAALVNEINQKRPDHILTIEDPVEHIHPSSKCTVNQREVGAQTESFARALRAALREDPDVIVLGELRDLETISLAITAAETGHLVLGTLHTSNAIRTINRLLAVFPPEQQAQIGVMLSESLRAVVSQKLVKRADGRGQVAAVETMFNTPAIGNLIRENRTHQIKSAMQTGAKQGQYLLDQSLSFLLKQRVISKNEALRHAEDPEAFR